MSVDTGAIRRRRRTGAISAAVLAIASLVITGFAIHHPGLSSSEVDVNNGGVWVTNRHEGLMGRLNVDAQELDARIAQTGDDLGLLQSGYDVIETGPRGFTPINTEGLSRGGVVELATGSQVKLGGDRVAIASPDGKVWVMSPDEAAAFTPSGADPVYESQGTAPRIAVSTEGTVFVLDGDQLLTFPREPNTRNTKKAARKPVTISGVSTKPESLQLSTVGEEPVILDAENQLLRLGTKGKDVSLVDQGVASLEDAKLQQQSTESDQVAVATADALFLVPLGGGDPQKIPAGGSGEPTEPAQAKGCAYGAWSTSNRYVRACEGQEPVPEAVPDTHGGEELTLRVNHDLVVLNDQEFGLSWMIAEQMQVVDDWVITQDIETSTAKEKEKETLTTTITNVAAERDKENRKPTANDDEFGVRAGQSIVLPVVRNDTDPDGDVLTVGVKGRGPSIGTVTPIEGDTQLQVDVADDATGSQTFTYTADDGRGGTDTATVTLNVVPEGENSAPRPAEDRLTKVQVRAGESVSLNILPYWEDPDGDAFYLSNATMEPEDIVSFTPDGRLTINDAGLTTGKKEVTLQVRDENGKVGEGTLEIEAVADADLTPITTADHVSIVQGRSATIKPLANDLNPNGGDLELTKVSKDDRLEIDPALEAGTVKVSGQEPGTYYLDYAVASSGTTETSPGVIRVDVLPESSEELVPVAVDDMGTVTTGTETLIDPLQNDVDPTGGVLVVNGVDVPEDSGLKATVVGHSLLRIEAEPGAEVTGRPVPLTYHVANSAGQSEGTARVMLAQTDTQFANPVTVPDRATVRAGDMVLIDALDNDSSPTGSDLTVEKLLDTESADAKGRLEVTEDRIRYLADPGTSGEVTLTYQVIDETGRRGSARVTISIIAEDAANTPPRPENLTARTVSGTPVRIPVRTTGVDPDGDSVIITGIASPAPSLGEVTETTGEWIEYTPHDGATGTDRFRYQVMDRSGAVGTAEVQVGIAAPSEQNQPPYAVNDTVEVQPGRDVQVPVLANDTDPEGAPLSVDAGQVEAISEIEVTPQEESPEGMVTVTTPEEPGTHTVQYAASDGQLSSTGTITVKVNPDAPLLAPIARDDFVSPDDALDPEIEYVDVDVRANDADPDGATTDLEVTLPDGAPEGTQARDDGTVRVTPREEQQRIRYRVEDPDGLEAYGYIWVPGTAKQPPVWVGEPVTVDFEGEASIDLSSPENVRVRPGAEAATITDAESVSADHADGSQLVTDAWTITYRPAAGFSGQDTVSVEVSDGASGDATAATATLAIPIEVKPSTEKEENLPPTFQGASLRVEQGESSPPVDLSAGAEDPEGDALQYALGSVPEGKGVDVALEGSTLTATASTTAVKGTIIDVPVTVTDGSHDPVTASVQVNVTGSNRPLISAGLDTATIDAGETRTVDVLANDSNPFEDGKRTLEDARVKAGKGEAVAKGDQVEISPDAGFHGTLTVEYAVLDDTGDPDRRVTGEVRVTVRDVPQAPSAPRIGEVGDGSVELRFSAGDDNGAPITGYTVTPAGGSAKPTQCPATSCTITGLANDTEYTFRVTATNEVGESEPSVASAKARPDVKPEKPAAPSAERGDTRLKVAWSAPENRGSAIQSYDVQIQDTATGQTEAVTIEGGATTHEFSELTNGIDYRFRVRAKNLADDPSDWSAWSAPEHPAGKPGKPGGKMEASRVNDPIGGGVTVTWPAMTTAESNGEPITQYVIASSGGQEKTVTARKGTNSYTFRGLDEDTEYSFTYTGVNSVGTGASASAASNEVVPWAKPEAPGKVTAKLPDEGKGAGPNGRVDVSWEEADGGGTAVKDYVVSWSGQTKIVDASQHSTRIEGLTNGKAYTFTVKARNRFEGGESAYSKASNSVTPYTTPAAPSVSAAPGSCSGSSCSVTFSSSANGSGGADPVTLTCSIDGGAFGDCPGWVSGSSGQKHTITVRARNRGGLVNEASAEANAPTATPTPSVSGEGTVGDASHEKGCTTRRGCYYIDFTVSGLDPNTTYTYCVKGEGLAGGNCWYPTTDGSTATTGTLTTDGNGRWQLHGDGRKPYWGNADKAVWIWVEKDGKSADSNKVHPVK